MTFTYPAVFKKTAKGYTGTFPDLPGIEVTGETIDEATRNAREAMYDWISVELDEDEPHMPMITDISDMKLKRGEIARSIGIHFRFFEGWDE